MALKSVTEATKISKINPAAGAYLIFGSNRDLSFESDSGAGGMVQDRG